MRLLATQNPTVIRDGQTRQIPQEQIVDGDLIIYGIGDQIIVDSRIEEGEIEVNEAFITGEADSIKKRSGDQLTSGSFVVSGVCKATVTAVGAENYIAKLEASAHTIKATDAKLFKIMNNIVKYISFVLVPIGALLLWARFRTEADTGKLPRYAGRAAMVLLIAAVLGRGAIAYDGMRQRNETEGLREIGKYAFHENRLLSVVNFPGSLEKIHGSAFLSI